MSEISLWLNTLAVYMKFLSVVIGISIDVVISSEFTEDSNSKIFGLPFPFLMKHKIRKGSADCKCHFISLAFCFLKKKKNCHRKVSQKSFPFGEDDVAVYWLNWPK